MEARGDQERIDRGVQRVIRLRFWVRVFKRALLVVVFSSFAREFVQKWIAICAAGKYQRLVLDACE
jgi:hypothetical protein